MKDLLGNEAVPGKELLIPEDPKYLKEDQNDEGNFNGSEIDEGQDTMDEESSEENQQEESKEEEKEKQQSEESSSGPHDGKYFVVQKGMCQCDKGFKFPKFKVTSHQKHYWNDKDGKADFLAVTEDDLTLDPPAMPFGNCKLKPSSGGYLPCAYAPAGKWTKTYEKVKVMGKSCVTELSELSVQHGWQNHNFQTRSAKRSRKKQCEKSRRTRAACV
ncbi:DUF4280 domain-containing protein [Chryseobacterium indoltheticum]|uniref:DUF4280 domain-containing protein n=1 Tax=Chryseobacterium indoltheticum TaxID=254 RepID=UPI003F4925A5